MYELAADVCVSKVRQSPPPRMLTQESRLLRIQPTRQLSHKVLRRSKAIIIRSENSGNPRCKVSEGLAPTESERQMLRVNVPKHLLAAMLPEDADKISLASFLRPVEDCGKAIDVTAAEKQGVLLVIALVQARKQDDPARQVIEVSSDGCHVPLPSTAAAGDRRRGQSPQAG